MKTIYLLRPTGLKLEFKAINLDSYRVNKNLIAFVMICEVIHDY